MFETASRARCYLALSRALAAGLPLTAALDLAGQGGSAADRSLRAARSLVEGRGETLAEALPKTRAGRLLPAAELTLIGAGETHGELPKVLVRLAQRLERRHRRTQRFLFGLAYPILLLHALVLAVHAPKIVSSPAAFFASVLPTFLVLWTFALATFGGLAYLARRQDLRRRALELLRRVPALATFLRLRSAADYAETFGLGIAAGVPVLQAMQLGGEAASWSALQRSVARATQAVRDGATLEEAHRLHLSRQLPRELLEALRLGEATGELEESLARAAESLDERTETLASRIAVVVPVVIYLLVALLIAVVVISAFVGFQQLTI